MGLRRCKDCEEMVDEAMAFCPGCGNALVNEVKRKELSLFEQSDRTVQFGKTMFGSILSDMGLDISKAPNVGEERVETIAPLHAKTAPVQPKVAPPVHAVGAPKESTDKTNAGGSSDVKWFVLGGLVLVLLFLFVLAAAAIVFMVWSRS